MKQYETYKDSGIQWLGKVPSHWEITPLKYNLSLKGRIGWNGLKSDEFKESSYAYLVTGQDFNKADIDWSSCYQIDKKRYEEDPFIQLSNGDLLVTKDGTIGKVAKVSNLDKPACLNRGIFVVKRLNPTFESNFLYWTFVSNQLLDFNNFNSSGSTIQHLYQNVFENMPLLVPLKEEQKAIASYLDYKVSQIDAAIKEKEAMLEDLKAYRTAIISEAVTKGLDKGVTFVESGNEAIGNIPLGWKVMKTLYCLSMPITDGPHTTPELLDEGIPFISAEAVSCGNGKIDFTHKRGYISQDFYEECCNKYIPQRNDIYMIKSGATTGKVAIVDTDEIFTIWSPLAVFRCDIEVMLPSYMFYLLQSTLYQSQVELGWSFGTQQNIGMRVLEKIPVPVPPIEEQQSIVEHITNKIYKLDKAIGELSQSSNDLQSYKSSVISEAVTGKVDLRNWNKKTVTA